MIEEPRENLVLSAWLKGDEDNSRSYRQKRLQKLLAITDGFEDRIVFHGAELSLRTYEELRLCFVQSLDVAVVLLSLAFVERELSAMLYARGIEAAKNAKLAQILDWATDHQLLELDNKRDFDILRLTRNAYAHFRHPSHKEGLTRRTVEVEENIDGLIETDADFALRAVVSFLKNRPDF